MIVLLLSVYQTIELAVIVLFNNHKTPASYITACKLWMGTKAISNLFKRSFNFYHTAELVDIVVVLGRIKVLMPICLFDSKYVAIMLFCLKLFCGSVEIMLLSESPSPVLQARNGIRYLL